MTLVRATRSEFTKQRTTAMWWILLIILVGYIGFAVAGLALVFGSQSDDSPSDFDVSGLIYGLAATAGYAIPLLLGTLLVTGEYRHQTLTPTFLATPRRGTVLWAKTLSGAVLGALYGVAGVIVSVGAGAGILSIFGVDTKLGETDTWALIARVILAYMLWALIGVGLGSLISNQIAAIVGVLVFTQFIEPLLLVAQATIEALKDVLEFLPGAATNTLIGSSFFALATPATGAVDPWWTGGLYLLGYAVVFLFLGYLIRWRRDVN